mgnify:CR=1 FL=1
MSYIPLADDPPRMTTGINLHSTPPIVEPVAIHGSYNFEDNRDETEKFGESLKKVSGGFREGFLHFCSICH